MAPKGQDAAGKARRVQVNRLELTERGASLSRAHLVPGPATPPVPAEVGVLCACADFSGIASQGYCLEQHEWGPYVCVSVQFGHEALHMSCRLSVGSMGAGPRELHELQEAAAP